MAERKPKPKSRAKSKGNRRSAARSSSRQDSGRGELQVLWGLLSMSARPDGTFHFGAVWGLVSLGHDYRGSWYLNAIWGMINLRTSPRRRAVPERSALDHVVRVLDSLTSRSAKEEPEAPTAIEESPPADPATARAEQRLDALRKATICFGIGVGIAFLGVWELTLLFLAISLGLVLSTFAERLASLLFDRETQQVLMQEDAKRIVAGDHARDMQSLSASIAHEIRNPITAAKSLVQQMGEDPGATDNIEYAKVALDELDRVERSVSHLLRFAREEKLDAKRFQLAEIATSALAAVRERAEEHRIELRTEIDTKGELHGDPEQLRRVILNLVGNAINALIEGETQRAWISLELGENLAGTEVWLRVSDNGPGIPAEDQSRIFTPFHTSRQEGTGLGLAITKKIVDAHGGSIELKSTAGSGADFLLTFPKRGIDAE